MDAGRRGRKEVTVERDSALTEAKKANARLQLLIKHLKGIYDNDDIPKFYVEEVNYTRNITSAFQFSPNLSHSSSSFASI